MKTLAEGRVEKEVMWEARVRWAPPDQVLPRGAGLERAAQVPFQRRCSEGRRRKSHCWKQERSRKEIVGRHLVPVFRNLLSFTFTKTGIVSLTLSILHYFTR